MCGRFGLIAPDDIRERFRAQDVLPGLEPRYNAAPGQDLPVVAGEERRLELMRWGLVPSWAKDRAIGNKLINARAETLAEKPSFRHALRSRRCLVPANGFYEWRREGRGKTPYWIHRADGELFAFAGLWESWREPTTGEDLHTFTIVTTEPNELVAPIHDRMPAMLREGDEGRWLDPDATEYDELRPMLAPYPAELMAAYPVSPRVNRPGVDVADLVEPEVKRR